MKKLFLYFLMAFFAIMPFSVRAQVLQPVQWSFSLEPVSDDEFNFVATATIDPAYHIYSTSMPELGPKPTEFVFEQSEDFELVGAARDVTEGHKVYDDIFGVEYYEFGNTAVFAQTLKRLTDKSFAIKGSLAYQACNDGGCLSLEEDFDLLYVGSAGVADDKTANAAAEKKTTSSTTNIWTLIIEAILWGFAALLTPCVFPMIPMTVSFFLKGSENKLAGRFRAIMYFIFIVALYTIPIALIIFTTWIFGGDSVTADIFNWLATHWLPNIIFFLVFMIFAASFFGAFEINLSGNLVNKSDSKQGKGGLGGVFFMALTLVLVSFACTGPIVGTVLIKSTSGEFWTPIITMLAFSTAFALPFALFALFPSLLKNLPKSGGWLNSVKVVLGFIEVALGFKFLSVADQTYHWGLLDREVYLAIWIICFTLLGFYLLGKIKFAHDSDVKHISVGRLALVILDFTFVLYMLPGMWGAPLKALSGYLPPKQTMDFDLMRITQEHSDKVIEYIDRKGVSSGATVSNSSNVLCEEPKYSDFLHLPHGIKGYFDYEQALACAKLQNKPIFVDFTGHGCVNCREMEANVWSDPRVLEMLKNDFVVVALYVDDKTNLPENEWITSAYDGKVKKSIGRKYADFQISKFNTNAQPYYVLMGHNGEVLMDPRAYNLDKDAFVAFLKEGIENFKQGKSVRNINE